MRKKPEAPAPSHSPAAQGLAQLIHDYDLDAAAAETVRLWQAQEFGPLIEIYVSDRFIHSDSWRIRSWWKTDLSCNVLQEELILKVPAQAWADLYAAAVELDHKRALTLLIWDLPLVRSLITSAWERGDLETVAVHYGGLLNESHRNDYLTGSRGEDDDGGSMDGYPLELLQALRGYFARIENSDSTVRWLDEEIKSLTEVD